MYLRLSSSSSTLTNLLQQTVCPFAFFWPHPLQPLFPRSVLIPYRDRPSHHLQKNMAFISPFVSSFTSSSRPQLTSRRPLRVARFRMGVGEDGLQEDLQFAQNCIEEGCSVDAVQDVLTRLERRRAVLALEVSQIEEIMGVLAKENLGGDRNLIADAMAAAVSIFAKANDDYPGVGSTTNAWTLDPLKKQPKL